MLCFKSEVHNNLLIYSPKITKNKYFAFLLEKRIKHLKNELFQPQNIKRNTDVLNNLQGERNYVLSEESFIHEGEKRNRFLENTRSFKSLGSPRQSGVLHENSLLFIK